MRYEKLIRRLPLILVIVALVDFLKQLLVFLSIWHADRVISHVQGQSTDLNLQIIFGSLEQLIGLIIFPLGWITSAAILTIALAIYDKGSVDA